MTDRSTDLPLMDVTVTVVKWTWQSWIAGLTTVAAPVAISVANHKYGSGSTWIDAFAVLLAFIALLSGVALTLRAAFRGTPDKAIEYLQNLEK